MTQTIMLATTQMDATPTSLANRLTRAEKLIADAVRAGAQLVLLPEFFNVGYSYAPINYDYIEPKDGTTYQWMVNLAKQHNIHLAGTFMVLDEGHVYNRAFLIAPDGRTWHYDKTYPFGWERAFFRANKDKHITVANTDLGNIGMMICWDSAHADLWAQYAGKVDMMLIPSCPPYMNKPRLTFADGSYLDLYFEDNHFADSDIHNQAQWLGIPVVHSGGAGRFESTLPLPRLSLIGLLLKAPRLLIKHIRHANKATISADFGEHSKIIDAHGEPIALVQSHGDDGFALATIELSSHTDAPTTPQPDMKTQRTTFFLVDVINTRLVTMAYRKALRKRRKS